MRPRAAGQRPQHRGRPGGALTAASPRADSVERLVKQLSEAFGVQTEPPAAARPRQEPAAAPGREAERPPSPGGCCEATPRAPRPAGTAPAAGKCGAGGAGVPRAVGGSGRGWWCEGVRALRISCSTRRAGFLADAWPLSLPSSLAASNLLEQPVLTAL